MTNNRHTDEAGSSGGATRAGALSRLLWTRALPGSVAVVAALTIPEFSVGAGDLTGARDLDKPLDPPSKAGQGLGKRVPNAAKQPLAGVRYGALFEVSAANTLSADPSRLADLAPAAIISDGATLAVSPSVEAPAAFAAVVPPPVGGLNPRQAGTGRTAPSAVDALDDAATFAVSVLEDFAASPGLQGEAGLASGVPAIARTPLASPDALDTVAAYAASALEKFAATPSSAVPLTNELGIVADDRRIAALSSDLPLSVLQPQSQPAVGEAPLVEIAAPFASAVPQAVPAGLAQPMAASQAPALAAQPAAASAPVLVAQPAAAAPALSAPPRITQSPAASQSAALQAAGLAPLPKPAIAAPPPGLGKTGPLAFEITSQLLTRVDGKAAGTVDFQQTTTGLAVRLGSIVDVLGDRYDPGEIARIKASAASNLYIPLAELQAQGIPISYDPVYDEFNVGQSDTRPKAARKVHMDQITTPERGLGTAVIDQVRR